MSTCAVGRPGQQDLAAGADVEGEQRADGNAVAQAGAGISGSDAQTVVARPHIQLDALGGRLVKAVEDGPGDARQVELGTGHRSELSQPRTEAEGSRRIPGHQPVRFERD